MDSHLEEIKRKWDSLHEKGGVFAYKLNVTKSKILEGNYGVYCELNSDRTTKRRMPQQISMENLKFDPEKFNFTKVKPEEILLEIPFESSRIFVLINQSPLTRYHCLIVPDLQECIPQALNYDSIRFSVSFLMNVSDESFKIGFNSPGALASVNHLHLHLFQLHRKIFIETIDTVKLRSPLEIYKANDENIQFICFKINSENFSEMVKKLYDLTKWMMGALIPHNLLFLKDSCYIKAFVFAKKEAIVVKTLGEVNIAFCELSGFVPVGSEDVYERLNEKDLLRNLKEAAGDIYEKIYNFLEK